MRAVALTVVMLAGCTAIFGLRAAPSVDADNDGIEDGVDNCHDVPNGDQSDFDGDGRGDRCDTCESDSLEDLDADGTPDACDGCIGNTEDVDEDGIDDGCDRCIETGVDEDNDRIDDACDACVFESGVDSDSDLIDDACDQCIAIGIDEDNDSVDDACDPCISSDTADVDQDGSQDACDACVAETASDVCGACVACTPCATPTGFDEDADFADDGCDLCKLVNAFSNHQTDADGDGVGAVCELSFTVGEDELFDGFNAPHPAWYFVGYGWTLGSGRTSITSTGTTSYRFRGTAKDLVAVRATFRTPNVGGRSIVGAIVTGSLTEPTTKSLSCILDTGTGIMAPQLRLMVNGIAMSITSVSAYMAGEAYLIGVRSKPSTQAGMVDVNCELVPLSTRISVIGSPTTVTVPALSSSESWSSGVSVSGTATLYGYSVLGEKGAIQL